MEKKKWRLEGKKAVVSGASRGIGKAIALELLSLGAKVLAVARGEEGLRVLQKETNADRNLYTLVANAGEEVGRKRIKEIAEEKFGTIDILINNVGTNIRKPALEYDQQELDHLFHTNLFSAYWLSVLLHPLMMEKGGSIVNISSVAGHTHLKTGVVYAMTKAAMNQMTRNLALEWAGKNIRVNAVSPWYTRTPLAEQVLRDDHYRNQVLSRTPLDRIAETEEVASLVVYLCMDKAAYITGQVLTVDGGFSVNGFHPEER